MEKVFLCVDLPVAKWPRVGGYPREDEKGHCPQSCIRAGGQLGGWDRTEMERFISSWEDRVRMFHMQLYCSSSSMAILDMQSTRSNYC